MRIREVSNGGKVYCSVVCESTELGDAWLLSMYSRVYARVDFVDMSGSVLGSEYLHRGDNHEFYVGGWRDLVPLRLLVLSLHGRVLGEFIME